MEASWTPPPWEPDSSSNNCRACGKRCAEFVPTVSREEVRTYKKEAPLQSLWQATLWVLYLSSDDNTSVGYESVLKVITEHRRKEA